MAIDHVLSYYKNKIRTFVSMMHDLLKWMPVATIDSSTVNPGQHIDNSKLI